MDRDRHQAWAPVAASLALAMGACSAPETADESPGVTRDAEVTQNALTANALTANALTANALTANALTANALTANALTAGALASDPLAREVLRYITSCALPEGAHFDLEVGTETYGFDGSLGLAPHWGEHDGHCDAGCRTWVSACVLARLNYLGETVALSIRGNKAALTSTHAERKAFPSREAAYYGDIFAAPQVRLGCLPPGISEDPRVCGPSLSGCAVRFVGDCRAACDGPRADGSYPNCRDHVRDASGHFPGGTKAFGASITVFLAN